MRRLAKARSSAPTEAAVNPGGTLAGLALALCAMLLAAGLLSASASAAPTPAGSFACSVEDPCGAFDSMSPGRLAVDEVTGSVYVIDTAHDVVNEFSASGEYISQLEAPDTFGFDSTVSEITVDNTPSGANQGNVYVAGGLSGGSVFAFEPDGDLKWEADFDSPLEPCGLSVDPSGSPWVMTYGASGSGLGISQLNVADGTTIGTPKLTELASCFFDFDGLGNAYVVQWNGHARKFNSDEEMTMTLVPPSDAARDVAVDRTNGNVYVAEDGAAYLYDEAATEVEEENGEKFAEAELTGNSAGVTVNGATGKIYVGDKGGSEVLVYQGTLMKRLTVNKIGTGTVTSDPVRVDCGAHCIRAFDVGTPVTLTAAPLPNTLFTGWSGCDAEPAGKCEVTMSEAKSVSATFVTITHNVAVTVTGEGSVSANSGAISGCTAVGGTCSGTYNQGTPVQLTATPGPNQELVSWSGCDSEPAGKCQVTVGADEAVTATFAQITHELSVTKAGSGSGTVTCDGGPCAAEYDEGTELTLAATAAAGSSFAGWSGACSGTGPCAVTIDADTALTATFNADPVITPPVIPVTPTPPTGGEPPVVKPLKCKKGFKKKTVKGKKKCVKVKKKAKKRHH